MAVKGRLLTDEQWERVKKFIPERVRSPRGGRPPADDRDCFVGILRFAKAEPAGETFRTSIPQQAPAGVNCRNGKTLVSSLKCGMRSSTSLMNEAI